MAYCASCGSENPLEAVNCVRCGADVHSPPPVDTPIDAAPDRAPEVATGTLPPRDIGELLSETFRVLRRKVLGLCLHRPLGTDPLPASPDPPGPPVRRSALCAGGLRFVRARRRSNSLCVGRAVCWEGHHRRPVLQQGLDQVPVTFGQWLHISRCPCRLRTPEYLHHRHPSVLLHTGELVLLWPGHNAGGEKGSPGGTAAQSPACPAPVVANLRDHRCANLNRRGDQRARAHSSILQLGRRGQSCSL